MTIEMVDFPLNMVMFQKYVELPEGMSSGQNEMLKFMPCTNEGCPLSLLKVLCDLQRAKAKQ